MLTLLLAFLTFTAQQEVRPVPKDSMAVSARGCLKGRVFTVTANADHGEMRGPDIVGRRFRINGKKDVTDMLKKHDGHVVEINGVVRKADLQDEGVGFKVGGSRVVIGAQGTNPNSPRNIPAGPPTVPTMDATQVVFVQDRCPLQ
jgi:hypothetical protein